MGGLAHSGFGMGRDFFIDTPTKSDPALLLISIFHTNRRSERFSFASMFAGTGRESAASRHMTHAREGRVILDALLLALLSDDTSIDYGWQDGVASGSFAFLTFSCLSAALL